MVVRGVLACTALKLNVPQLWTRIARHGMGEDVYGVGPTANVVVCAFYPSGVGIAIRTALVLALTGYRVTALVTDVGHEIVTSMTCQVTVDL
jgi:hypothetical protein